jgi:hypothetical protein
MFTYMVCAIGYFLSMKYVICSVNSSAVRYAKFKETRVENVYLKIKIGIVEDGVQ